uniref:Uncharacterized protein n=1 Tax=Oryzias sinensis TaxID=183150 RepID=A0A8C8DP24_9TELE
MKENFLSSVAGHRVQQSHKSLTEVTLKTSQRRIGAGFCWTGLRLEIYSRAEDLMTFKNIFTKFCFPLFLDVLSVSPKDSQTEFAVFSLKQSKLKSFVLKLFCVVL